MCFRIATPVRKGEKFLDRTIPGALGQAGPFAVRYRVQDCGSKGTTPDILTAWQARLARGLLPPCYTTTGDTTAPCAIRTKHARASPGLVFARQI